MVSCGAWVHSSTRKRSQEAEYDRPLAASLSNVAIKFDFRSEEWQLKALKTVSACGQRCFSTITWAEMKHDLPPSYPPPPSHNINTCSSAPLPPFVIRGERERERVPENECGGRDIIAFLSFSVPSQKERRHSCEWLRLSSSHYLLKKHINE